MRILVALILLLLCCPVMGQHIKFEHIDINNGLSQNSILSMTQDSDGFIWFGTEYGLNKYNGYDIEVFVPMEDKEGSLVGNEVWSLFEDSRGRLWVGTNEGVNIFDKESHLFRRLDVKTEQGEQINGTVSYILEDRSGNFWFGTFTQGIYKLDEDKLSHYEITRDDPQVSATSFRIWSMHIDQNGILWAGTWNQGIIKLDTRNNRFEYLTTSNSSLKSNDVRTFLSASDSTIWIGTRNGIQVFNTYTTAFSPTINERLNNLEFIQNMIKSEDEKIWIASYGRGLFLYDENINSFSHFYHEEDNPNSLSGDLIYSLLEDNSGCIWVGPWLGGVNKYCPDKNKFVCCTQYDIANIMDIDGAGQKLLIGTYGNGLYILDEQGEEFVQIDSDRGNRNGILSNLILDIANGGDGNYWIGYNGAGFSKFDFRSETFEHFRFEEGKSNRLNSSTVRKILVGNDGRLWLGTGGGGLNVYNPDKQTFRYFSTNTTPSISSNIVTALFEDSNGYLWIGSRGGGLNKMDQSLESVTVFRHHTNSANTISSDYIWDIWEDNEGGIWIATSMGLNSLNPYTEQITSYTEKDGLGNNWVYSILDDDSGRLWLSTNRGLSVFDPVDKSFTNYDVQDGLQSNEFNAAAKYKSEDGRLYFGGINGFNAFYPGKIPMNTKEPNVVLTSLEVLNKPVPIGEKGSNTYSIPKHISQLNELTLSHKESVISLEFAALHYVNPQKNRYQYMLEGFDKDWVEAGTRRYITYTNLNARDYTFRVRGANSDGYWSSEEATLAIIVLPPPWKTWWAYSLYVLVIAGGVIFGVRTFIVREQLKSNLKLEQLELQKAQELDQTKSRFFAGISHEFRTPLTLISAPVKELIKKHNEDDETRQNLEMVDQNASRLLDLVNQLLDLSKLEAGKLSLKMSKDDIYKLLKIIAASFQSLAESRQVTFTSNIPDEALYIYFDREKIEHIIINMLSNAFKFSSAYDKVELQAFSNDEQLHISVRDTGRGIPQEKLAYIFDRFYQVEHRDQRSSHGSGIGLALVKELVELHHGHINVESKEREETIFTVTIPTPDSVYKQEEIIERKPIKETDSIEAKVTVALDKKPVKNDTDKPMVLVVEDNEELREYMCSALKGTYSIKKARNGQEGLEKSYTIPDLIISDLMMPKMNGQEMLQQLKNDPKTNHIPLIMLTAKADRESKLKGLNTGADHYINKPFDMDELRVRVKSLIAQRDRVRDHYYKEFISSPSIGDIHSADDRFLQKAMEVLEQHIGNSSLTVDQFAGELAMSRVQLHRKLKAILGCSATEFMREVRLKKAYQYLKSKKGTVSEIAYEVGFNNLSYFAKCFKEAYDVNPSELL